jgi:integrase
MDGRIITRASGALAIIYDVGKIWDEEKGKYRRKRKSETVPARFDKNGKKYWAKVDAKRLLVDRITQLTRGEFIEPSNMTFAEYKDIWLNKYAKGEVKKSTLNQYTALYKNHMIPALGGIKLSQIGVEDVQGFKSDLKEKGLSPQMVTHNLRLLRQMLNHAVDWDYLRKNPALKVKYPKIPKNDKRMEESILTPDEIRVLLDQVSEKWKALLLVAITGGLRIGEILAMKWGNLDWGRGQYFVRETWVRPVNRANKAQPFAEPKSESSIAPVDLIPTCLDALRAHRKLQAEEILKAGEKYQDIDLIFATASGGPLEDTNVVRRMFHPALMAGGIRSDENLIRFHDLRHTCASLLIAQGENHKNIQKQLRHASADITLNRYTHLFPDPNQEVAKRLDAAIFGNQSQKEAV